MKNKVWVVEKTFSEKHDPHFENKHPSFAFFFGVWKYFCLYLSINLRAGGHYPAQMFYFTDIIFKWSSQDRPQNEF